MEKNLLYGELLDIYKALLTEKQAEAMEYYYESDYSLGEISELMDISRQGVRDFIKRGEAVMDEMEEKLKLIEKFRAVNNILSCAEEIKVINKSGISIFAPLSVKRNHWFILNFDFTFCLSDKIKTSFQKLY